MTMRTYDYFVCPNGHRGEEKTTENDQPYWEARRIRKKSYATLLQIPSSRRRPMLR